MSHEQACTGIYKSASKSTIFMDESGKIRYKNLYIDGLLHLFLIMFCRGIFLFFQKWNKPNPFEFVEYCYKFPKSWTATGKLSIHCTHNSWRSEENKLVLMRFVIHFRQCWLKLPLRHCLAQITSIVNTKLRLVTFFFLISLAFSKQVYVGTSLPNGALSEIV